MILKIDCFSSYLAAWFEETRNSSRMYREPVVDDSTVRFMELACMSLRQDTHVFVSAVEILDKYVWIKERMQESVEDPVLAAVCAVFLCSKYNGEQSDLRASCVEEYLSKVTKKR